MRVFIVLSFACFLVLSSTEIIQGKILTTTEFLNGKWQFLDIYGKLTLIIAIGPTNKILDSSGLIFRTTRPNHLYITINDPKIALVGWREIIIGPSFVNMIVTYHANIFFGGTTNGELVHFSIKDSRFQLISNSNRKVFLACVDSTCIIDECLRSYTFQIESESSKFTLQNSNVQFMSLVANSSEIKFINSTFIKSWQKFDDNTTVGIEAAPKIP